MNTKIKSNGQAIAFGSEIRKIRKMKNISILEASLDLNIDAGQLSRFERGKFVFVSKNLQIYMNYLQIIDWNFSVENDLTNRFTQALKKSSKHLEAGTYMVSILESLDSFTGQSVE